MSTVVPLVARTVSVVGSFLDGSRCDTCTIFVTPPDRTWSAAGMSTTTRILTVIEVQVDVAVTMNGGLAIAGIGAVPTTATPRPTTSPASTVTTWRADGRAKRTGYLPRRI